MQKLSPKIKSKIQVFGAKIKGKVYPYAQRSMDIVESMVVEHTNLNAKQIDLLKKELLSHINDDRRQYLIQYIKKSKNITTNDIKTFLEIPFEYWQGMLLYQAKDWSGAEFLFRQAVEKNPSYAHANFKLGMSLFKQKKWDLAYAYMLTAINLDPKITKWHVQLRQSEVRLRIQAIQNTKQVVRSKKQFDSQAINDAEPIGNLLNNHQINSSLAIDIEEQIFIERLEQFGDDADIYASLAQVQYKQNKLWQSIDSWNKAIGFKDDNSDWFYQLGNAYEQLGHYRKASLAYDNAISMLGDNVPAEWYYRLGYVYEQQGHDNTPNLLNAQKFYELAIAHDKHLESDRFGVGVFHAQRRYWQDAINAYKQQLNHKAQDPELHYRLGFAYDRNYQWLEAEKSFQEAVSSKENPDWYFRLGLSQEKQQKYLEASKSYKYASDRRKKYTPYWFYRTAYALEKQGLHEQATQYYLKLRKDNSLSTKFDKNNELLLGQIISAIKLKQAFDVTSAETWFELGNIYELMQDWEEAEYAYSQAVARSLELKSLWYYRLGFVLAQQCKFIQACEALRSYRVMQRPHGVSEDILSKDLGFSEAAIYSEYYAVLPIREKTILYESFSGQGMSCNPYALFLYLFKHSVYKDWTHVWVINQQEKIPDEYKKYKNIIFTARGSDSYLRYLSTAQYLINNSTFPPCFIRKPEQKYLNTWHGTPFKTLGRDMEGRFFEHKNFTRNILQSTHLLSPNKHTSEVFYHKHDINEIYTGKLMELGYPRIDITLNQTNQEMISIRERLGISNDEFLIFYAPTWRGTHDNVDFDYEKLERDLNLLGDISDSKLVFRGHSLLQDALKEIELNVIVAPDDIDTNQILGVADILITDYSSVLFDFLPTLKPLILYMYDIKEYTQERGLYFDGNQLPGKKCYNINELVNLLNEIIKNGIRKVNPDQNMIPEFAPHDDGNVSERVVKAVFEDNYADIKVINEIPNEKKSILFYVGPFMGNGITTSALNLIANINPDKYTISLVIDPGSIEKEEGRLLQFDKLPHHVNVIGRVGRMDMTLEDRYIHGLNNQHFELISNSAQESLNDSWMQEYQRIFGGAKFDAFVHFEGYNRFWAGVFTSIENGGKTTIYMHNSMEEEYRLKYPYLKGIFGYARLANKVVSVSELTMQLNKDRLASRFRIPIEKFDYADNLQQPERTKLLANEPLLPEDAQYFSTKGKVFLTIGRLSVEKDHAKLIQAFSKIVKDYPSSKLLIVGDGSLRHELTQQIKSLSLQNNVYLLGLRSNPFPLLKKSDCFVLSSNHEGQPMTLFEAMILEKMIISTDIVGSRSALEGRSGHLVENSVQGLIDGMTDFLENKLQLTVLDIKDYQKQAIERFYQIALT